MPDSPTEYLRAALNAAPDDALRLRAAFLGLASEPSDEGDKEGWHEKRARLRDLLESIRSEFWKLPTACRLERLDGLRLENHPDLEAERSRLRRVADRAAAFVSLTSDPGIPPRLSAAILRFAVASPLDRPREIQRLAACFHSVGDSRRARKVLAEIGRRHREVHALIAEVAELLKKPPSIPIRGSAGGDLAGCLKTPGIYVLLWILMSALIRSCGAP